MNKLITLITAFFLGIFPGGDQISPSPTPAPDVLGESYGSEDIVFKVNVPAIFLSDIKAPNVVYSIKAGSGIGITGGDSQNLIITNQGIITLVAGDGISIDDNKITNTREQGFTSLSAGSGISVDGNKITNTLVIPETDYSLSGWTKTGTSVGLTTLTDSVIVDALTTGALSAQGVTANTITLRNGYSVLPDTDLGSDLGSSAYRFNNLWVGTINSNSSQGFSGQTTFSYPPTSTAITEASVLINPTTSFDNGQLLGLGIAGYQRVLIDEDGDITLGYADQISAPTSDYPLNIYGHNGTRVSFTDTTGNSLMAGNLTVGGSSGDQGRIYFGGANHSIRASSGLWYFTGLAGEELAIDLNAGGSSSFSITQGDFVLDNNALDQDIYLKVNDGGVDTVGLTVQGSTGNVGIGSTNPTRTLDIQAATAQLNLQSTTTANVSRIMIQNAGSNYIGAERSTGGQIFTGTSPYALAMGTVNSYPLQLATANTTRMTIDTSGNVGIGTTAPGAKLDVSQITLGHDITENASQGVFWNGAPAAGVGSAYGIYRDSGTWAKGLALNFATGMKFGINSGYSYIFHGATDGTSEVMRILGTGNVGIGTSAPGSNLEIFGTTGLTLRRDSTVYGVPLKFSEGGTIYWSEQMDYDGGNDNDLQFVNNAGTTVMHLGQNGNVGIGTTAPGAKLDIAGGIRLQGSSSGYVGFSAAGTSTSVTYTLPSADGTEGQVLSTNGLGTLSWVDAATVATSSGTVGNYSITMQISSGVAFASASYYTTPPSRAFDGIVDIVDNGWINNGGTTGYIAYQLGVASRVQTYTVYPFSNGGSMDRNPKDWEFQGSNNGVDWTTLDTQVNQTAWTFPLGNNYTFVNADTYSYYRLNFSANNGNGYTAIAELAIYESISTASQWNSISNDIYFSAGNVGIGKTNPAYTLDVKSSGTGTIARFASDNNTSCTLGADGTLSCSSDSNFKKNISQIEYGLEELLRLNPVSFNWNFDGQDKSKSLGFVAQDVEAVLPNLVGRDDNGYLTLNTIGMIPILTKAVQEQQLQIDEIQIASTSAETIISEMITPKLSLFEVMINEIKQIIVTLKDKIQTKELCLGDSSDEVCVTKDELRKLLDTLPSPTATAVPTATPSSVPEPSLLPIEVATGSGEQ